MCEAGKLEIMGMCSNVNVRLKTYCIGHRSLDSSLRDLNFSLHNL